MTLFEYYYQCICFSPIFFMYGSSLLGQKYPRRHFVRIKSGVSHLIINDVIKGKKECKERHTWSVSSHDGGLSLKSASSKSSNDFRLDFEEKL